MQDQDPRRQGPVPEESQRTSWKRGVRIGGMSFVPSRLTLLLPIHLRSSSEV